MINMVNIKTQKRVSLLLFLLAPLCCLARSPTDLLLGVWEHTAFVQTADGKVVRKYDSGGEATLEYRSDGTWRLNAPPHQSSGTYRWIANGIIESTIKSSDLPNQIGYTSIKKLSVHDGTLVLVTEYDDEMMKAMPARHDGTRPASMTVTSTFRKIMDNK